MLVTPHNVKIITYQQLMPKKKKSHVKIGLDISLDRALKSISTF